jgi:hypothetical protein
MMLMRARADKDLHPEKDLHPLGADDSASWSQIADEASERAMKEIREIFHGSKEKVERRRKTAEK